MEGGIADQTSMRPLKCKCFGSAAYGQPPSWVHTGLTASTVNVIGCHTKHENKRSSSARPPATKSPLLVMTSQNVTSPALHHQNQPPDSGSVQESQRRKLWLSRHRSHRRTCCVCFCLIVFLFKSVLQFSVERRGEVSTARPPATKSSFLLMTNQNTTSPVLYRKNRPHDSGFIHESQLQQL